MHKRILSSLLLALLPPLAAQAAEADGAARLKSFLSEVKSLKADFTQTVLDAQLNTDELSSGTFVLQRPGKFRWNYTEPYEQVIVADGRNLWIYDKTLEQVTVKPQDRSLASSPAMLLSGEGSLEESFTVENLGRQGEWVWVKLTPKVQDTEFEVVRIAFDGENVALMELTDLLGQTTRIRLENVQRNPDIPADRFAFTPPEGADVIGKPAG